MKSYEYREIVRTIVRQSMRKLLPGIKHKKEMADLIAKNVYARLYGANVDNVDSPLWRKIEPSVTAKELLELD